ncbi:hypothetical protein ACIGZJ_30770 [Kitasatospora sp. NPDC052868]|uniref:hypothetical protein n=1 Tax=Kitasatospora sp. NPDC052868 TaxID=3364060 RepID=UPI0037CA4DA4
MTHHTHTHAGPGGSSDQDQGVPPDLPELAEVDRAGRRLLVGSAQILAGLMTAGLLEHVRTPDALTDVLAPHVPAGPERDRLVFTAGAAAGLWAGQRRRRGHWDPDELQHAADDLYASGWAAMGLLAADAAHLAGGGR